MTMTISRNAGRARMTGAVALLLALFAAGAASAAPLADDICLAPADTLHCGEGELRGLAWLPDGRRVALIVQPDTLPGAPPVSARLAWFTPDGAPDGEADFTGTLVRGLAYDGKFLWSCGVGEDGGGLLHKIEADTLDVRDVYSTRGHRPTALAWDGRHVWMVDRDSGRLDRFDTETEEVTRSVTTPAFSPFGLAFDGDSFWTADSGTGRLYRLSRVTGTWNGTVDAACWRRRGTSGTISVARRCSSPAVRRAWPCSRATARW